MDFSLPDHPITQINSSGRKYQCTCFGTVQPTQTRIVGGIMENTCSCNICIISQFYMQAWQMINQNSLHAVARNKDWAPGPHQVAFTRNLANTFTENDRYTYEESSGGEEP